MREGEVKSSKIINKIIKLSVGIVSLIRGGVDKILKMFEILFNPISHSYRCLDVKICKSKAGLTGEECLFLVPCLCMLLPYYPACKPTPYSSPWAWFRNQAHGLIYGHFWPILRETKNFQNYGINCIF